MAIVRRSMSSACAVSSLRYLYVIPQLIKITRDLMSCLALQYDKRHQWKSIQKVMFFRILCSVLSGNPCFLQLNASITRDYRVQCFIRMYPAFCITLSSIVFLFPYLSLVTITTETKWFLNPLEMLMIPRIWFRNSFFPSWWLFCTLMKLNQCVANSFRFSKSPNLLSGALKVIFPLYYITLYW